MIRVNRKQKQLGRMILAGLGLLLGTGFAQAVVLNWSDAGVAWSAGSLSQSFDPDTTYAGNDLTIAVTGDTGKMDPGFPVDDNGLTGGNGSGVESLRLRADFNKNNQDLTVTITFNYNTWLADGARNVNFQIFDIDTDGSYVDQIKGITATTLQGTTIGATLTAGADLTVVNNGTVNATATGTAAEGADSPNGNLTIDFGTNIITSLSFTYANDSSADKNPNVQNVGLYNISFSKHAIPEVSVGWIAAAGCGVMIFLRRWRCRRGAGF